MNSIKVLICLLSIDIFFSPVFATSTSEGCIHIDRQKKETNYLSSKNRTQQVLHASASWLSISESYRKMEPPDEKEEIRKVINKLFDGMRKGDSTAVRSVFYPSAKLATAFAKEGKPQLKWDSIDEIVKAVGKPHTEVWDERIFDVEIHHDGLIASAWMKYAFYVDSKFSHCGVDALQLFKGESGWKIIQITDTRYKETCEEHRNKTSQKH